MHSSAESLSPAEAAKRLGISVKALRVYERRGLLAPIRTSAGWRAYGPDEIARAREIAALRALGFSLAQVARVLDGDAEGLEPALAAHQSVLEGEARLLADRIEKLRGLRNGLAQGDPPAAAELARLCRPPAEPSAAFDLPWPWGGERFELRDVRALNFIVGPLGSGKARFARRLAETLPGAIFLGLERPADGAVTPRIDAALDWIIEEGGTASSALSALLAGLESDGQGALVVDVVEQGLDQATQEALIAHLRRRAPGLRPLFLLTRSSAILDLAEVRADSEAIILCPANHSPPMRVSPYPGAPGFEAVATCLASPDVRARTEGVIAWRPEVA